LIRKDEKASTPKPRARMTVVEAMAVPTVSKA
jgi:hypothetical protein